MKELCPAHRYRVVLHGLLGQVEPPADLGHRPGGLGESGVGVHRDPFVLAYDEYDAKPYRWTYDGSPLKAA
ncbi:hypothetical protein [Streptomyces sp. NPDC001415]